MQKSGEPMLTVDLEDAEEATTEWSIKMLNVLAEQLGVGNDFYFPLLGVVKHLELEAAAAAPAMSEPTEQQVILQKLDRICDEIFERWDKDQRSGKLLTALAGRLPGYRADVDEVRAALSAAAPRRAEGPNNAGAILVRLRYAILTATNDDLSEPGTEKLTRHIARIEAMHDAMEEIVSLCAAAGLTVGERVPSKEGA